MKVLRFLTSMALLACVGNAIADELVVSDFNISAGERKTVSIELNNPTSDYIAFEFWMRLPDGVRIAYDGDGYLMAALSSVRSNKHDLEVSEPDDDGVYHFLCYSNNNKTFKEKSGEIISLTIDCATNAVAGMYAATIYDQIFSDPDKQEVNFPDYSFNITVEESDGRVLLSETSTTVPETAMGVNVRVLRTINAGEWSTICLPFAMTQEQVTTAFGDDVKLGDFTGYTAEGADENVTGIRVHFTSATAIEANHPYIIKVSQAVSEFTADGVDVEPEDEPTVAAVKRTKKLWSEFIGTYVAGTTVEDQMLFLSGNQFWYSNGSTVMKAFRGYFDFYDVLTEVENAANISFYVGDEATEISFTPNAPVGEGSIYDLQGRKLNGNVQLPKGIYIQNGKKVVK